MSAGAIGSIYNDVTNMMNDFIQMGKSQTDQADIRDSYSGTNGLMRLQDMDPEKLKIVAEQMGIRPDVLMSKIRNQQMDALRQMQNVAARGGLDDAAIAANNQSGIASARANAGQQQAIRNSMARRGLNAGSGAELAARGQAAQQSYNTVAGIDQRNAADAQMRALQAINSSGRMAGDIASADEQIAQANMDRKTGIDRYNVGLRDAANKFNAGAEQQNFNNKLNLRQAKLSGAIAKGGASRGLRYQQTKYMQDQGNRGQNIVSQFDFMGG